MVERRVKERLVGATILVALIVIVVPELLSGPRTPSAPPPAVGLNAPSRNVSVDVDSSKATPLPPEDPTAGGAAAASAAVAVAAAPAAAGPDKAAAGAAAPGAAAAGPATAGATVVTLKAQDAPATALETPASSPNSSSAILKPGSAAGRSWAVQLGSFASRVNADKLVRQLQAHGTQSVYSSPTGSGRAMRYRVRLGPLADRAAAERAVGKLKAEGHAATIVTPGSS
jgi:DedD protein